MKGVLGASAALLLLVFEMQASGQVSLWVDSKPPQAPAAPAPATPAASNGAAPASNNGASASNGAAASYGAAVPNGAAAATQAVPPASAVATRSASQVQGMFAGANLLRDRKNRDFRVNDIVSIVVSVTAEAATDEQAEQQKKVSKANFIINQYLKLKASGTKVDIKGVRPEDLGVDASGDLKFEGQGQNDRTDLMRTRLAATIVDIKPNGNLVLEAQHTFAKQREKTTITLSGVVRPQDVAPDNVVLSYNVADADIRYESSGPVSDANRRGWLMRILDKIWPF